MNIKIKLKKNVSVRNCKTQPKLELWIRKFV